MRLMDCVQDDDNPFLLLAVFFGCFEFQLASMVQFFIEIEEKQDEVGGRRKTSVLDHCYQERARVLRGFIFELLD
jgi:hypothetical protein